MSYWDYWRRVAMEEVMKKEERHNYWIAVKTANECVRYGEEDEISGLTNYLATSTTRL